MGNEYNVLESGTIECACGGKATLTSSVPNLKIAGAKPLYLKDILGAPVACPRSKNKCTKIVSNSTAGTETNVSATGLTYLLRTDGFKTDKGRAVVLKAPGQGTSKISSIPSLENQDLIAEEPIKKEKQLFEENMVKEKYQLYFLRRSQNIYKPLRPTRAFRKTKENFVSSSEKACEFDNIYSHTFAFLYISQNSKTTQYKIYSSGTLYNEEQKEIYFQNSTTKVKTKYIPIYEDSNIDIAYSNIELKNETDIKKLKKLSLNPKTPNKKDSYYIKDEDDINLRELTSDDIKNKTHEKVKVPTKKVLCIIDDILGEIEDMYEEYHTNYKLAFAQNHTIIEDIKKNNSYTYTIASMIDYFYVSKDEASTYKNSILELKKLYNEMVSLLLTDSELINLLVKDKDISKIIEKDEDKVSQSYFQQIQFLKKDFFNKELKKEEKSKSLDKAYYSSSNFKTSDKFLAQTYIYLTNSIKKTNRRYVSNLSRSGIKALEFNSSNDDFTQIKDNASNTLAHVLFSLLYSEKFENELKTMSVYSKLNSLRNSFLIKLKSIAPKPNISDNSIEDMQNVVEKQTIYHDIMAKTPSFRDKFLKEYEDLDYVKRIKSFEQKGEKVSFSSKYIYTKDENYYKNSIERPEDIIKKIDKKLQDTKLKELLKIYENINVEDKLSYVISCMNIVYLLSAPRTYLDQESDINSFFNDKLNHIYSFVENLTIKKIALNDSQKDKLTLEYQISQTYSMMQMRLILNDIIFSNSKKKALKFIEKYKVAVKADIKKDMNYKYIHDEAQNIKTAQREMYETLKYMEGITSNIDNILKAQNDKAIEQQKGLSKSRTTHLSTGLKTYGNLIAIAKITDYLFFDDSKKNISSHIGFIKDLTDVTVSIGLLVNKYPKTPMKVLEFFLKESKAIDVSNSSKRLLNFIEKEAVAKIAVVSIIITTAYDVVKLYKREDYDALSLTVTLGAISLALVLSIPTVPALVLGAIITIIGGILLNEIIDSDLDIYMKKSLLYKTIDFSILKQIRGIEQEKKYQAPYLFETTNKKEELKQISQDGFNRPTKLIEFIGKNYKGNEKYFDISLKNELSFFKSSIFGYKLELLGRRRERKLKNHYGHDTQIWQDTFVKIPSVLVEDKSSKFIFNSENNYTIIDKKIIPKEENYYVFDLLNQNFTSLEELNGLNHKKASIIVLSLQVELKFEFTYDYREIVYIDAVNFEQVSFTPEDIKKLEQFIEKKGK